MKFDISKPGFAVYVNIKGSSKTKAEETIKKYMEQMYNEDINLIFLPITDSDSGSTRIECFYNPS